MNASQTTLYRALLAELADIERQQEDDTLPHSDQHILDQAWEDVTNRIDELEAMVEAAPEAAPEEDWRDARVVLDRPSTPVPAEPVRFAPPPPRIPISVTLPAMITRDGRLMGKRLDGTWVPAPFPFTLSRPPPIEIPGRVGPTGCPPPPRPGGVTICNCDSDGQCGYCEEEELQRWNNMEDNREGCSQCSGCAYCQDGDRYDGADEV